MFQVGDKVVHPAHGAGTVVEIKNLDVLDDWQRYYVIELVSSDVRLMVPVRNADQVGLRPAATASAMSDVQAILQDVPQALPEDYKERQALVEQHIKSADLQKVCAVVRDLAGLRHVGALTGKDTELYERACSLVASEIAVVEGIALEQALLWIEHVLTERWVVTAESEA